MVTNLEIKDVLKMKMKKNENYKKREKNEHKNKNLTVYATFGGEQGHMSQDCWERKYCNNNKIFKKADKAVDGDKDNIVSCLLTTKDKKDNVKKKVWYLEVVKQPSEAGMMCFINGDMFYSLTKNTWI